MQDQKPVRKRKKKRRLRKPIRIFLWCMAGALSLYTANLGVKAFGTQPGSTAVQTIAKAEDMNSQTTSSANKSKTQSDSSVVSSDDESISNSSMIQEDDQPENTSQESQNEESQVKESQSEESQSEENSTDQNQADAATIGINEAAITDNEPIAQESASLNIDPQVETIATILVDAGHGGIDPGMAVTDENGNVIWTEKEITLKAAQEFKEAMAMINPSIRVELTRDSDTSTYTDMNTYSDINELNTRIDKINQTGANYYLSLHCNSGNPSFSGVDLFIKPNDDFSSTLAQQVFSAFDAIGWSESKQVTTVDQYPLHVVTLSPVPSMLVEMGYMTNETDRAKLTDDQQRTTLMQQLAAAYSEMILSQRQ